MSNKRIKNWRGETQGLSARVGLAEQVADYLTSEIDRGVYLSGQTLPPESELAERFGVSRTVIREALSCLKYDGLVVSRPRVGATVASRRHRRAFRIGSLQGDDAQTSAYLFEMRAMLESEAAALAAQRRTERDLKRLKAHINGMAQALAKGDVALIAHNNFHHAVSKACQNPYHKELIRYINRKLDSLIKSAMEESGRRLEVALTVQKEHEAIYEAIKEGDPERARAAALTHLLNGARRLGLPPWVRA